MDFLTQHEFLLAVKTDRQLNHKILDSMVAKNYKIMTAFGLEIPATRKLLSAIIDMQRRETQKAWIPNPLAQNQTQITYKEIEQVCLDFLSEYKNFSAEKDD